MGAVTNAAPITVTLNKGGFMPRKKNDTFVDEAEDMADDIAAEAVDAQFTAELTEQEKLTLEAEARAEVQKTLKQAESKRFKAAAKQRIQAEMLFRNAKDATGAELVTVDLMLASHPKFITLDGARYHSGRKYTVTKAVAAVLLDQQHRGWEQEYARVSPEVRSNIKQQRSFVLNQQGLKQVA